MPIDLAPLIDPDRTAVVVFECQQGLLGEGSPLPGLADSAKQAGLLSHLASLIDRARGAGGRRAAEHPRVRPELLGRFYRPRGRAVDFG